MVGDVKGGFKFGTLQEMTRPNNFMPAPIEQRDGRESG